jgi:hypothetical protein
MDLMSLQGWHELKCCECEGTAFTQAFAMIWQNGQGTSMKPVGHRCVNCGMMADQQRMIALAKKKDAEQKIKDLEAELG